jgi:prolyl oligopeptidase
MTESGYPSIVKRWKRGQPLEDAQLLMQIDKKEMGIWPRTHFRPEGNYTFVMRAITFRSQEILLLDEASRANELQLVNFPKDADFQGFWNGIAFAILRSDWRDARQGDVVALNMQTDDLSVLYHPDHRSSASYVATTQESLLIGTLENVTNILLELRLNNGTWETTTLPFDKTSELHLVSCDNFTSDYLVVVTNFLTPSTLYLYGPDLEQPCELKCLPARFDASGLEVKQCWATSKDGTQVPYFLVAKEGLKKDGNNPTLLYGYGGFEIPMTPGYNPFAGKLWLEQGGVYVLANIRGGGEFGPKWHQAALRENRHKAFEDFISIAEDLIRKQITSPQRLGIMGGSNGGLLMGAMLTQRPDLFKGVICAVPLLDMLRYHKLLAGASWMEEYGDPDDAEMREYIESYSPYQNVFSDRTYPQVLFITSTKDDRVHPGHARKMVAKMEDQGHKVFYYENTEGGHSAGANLKQHAKMDALKFVYLHKLLVDDAQ